MGGKFIQFNGTFAICSHSGMTDHVGQVSSMAPSERDQQAEGLGQILTASLSSLCDLRQVSSSVKLD